METTFQIVRIIIYIFAGALLGQGINSLHSIAEYYDIKTKKLGNKAVCDMCFKKVEAFKDEL